MKNLALKIEDVSKMYDLGQVGTGTLSKDLNRTWAKMFGKPDPYATLAEINDRTAKTKSGVIWALKDINIEVEQGEVLGIIGRNGAGKSTLLKILSKITSPTTGMIKTNGRMASLLEVGTGMHPEMTARENIFLNGAIMGMTRREIKRKLDDIVDFAGIGKYVDTPIKRFSSGMQVRLGFAVAAFLEPEILIVDEVLAVGDAEFQKRAVGKMKEVSQGGDRTVLFVSHNMASVQQLCSKAMVMSMGQKSFEGDTNAAIKYYLSESNLNVDNPESEVADLNRNKSKSIYNAIKKVWIENEEGEKVVSVRMGEKVSFCFEFELDCQRNNLNFGFAICNSLGGRIFVMNNDILYGELYNGMVKGIVKYEVGNMLLLEGNYQLDVSISTSSIEWIDFVESALSFDVISIDVFDTGRRFYSNHGSFYNPNNKIIVESID